MNTEVKLVDGRGQQIRLGDTIVWPGRKRSRVWISTGIVVDMLVESGLDGNPKVTRLKVRIEFSDRVVYLGPVGIQRALRIE